MSAVPMQLHSITADFPQKYGRLARRLEEFASAARTGRFSLGLLLGSTPLLLEYQGPGTLRAIAGAPEQPVPAGCFAKPVTATLLADTVSAGHIDWSTPIMEILGLRGAAANKLAGVTLSQLLNHTHGLDASAVKSAPRTPQGLIDGTALCEALAATSLSTPGRLYSYSNAGAWLAGAALERLTAIPYSRLLSATPYIASNESVQTSRPESLCPATGGVLELTTSQWLAFAELHAESGPPVTGSGTPGALATLRSSLVSLPGWSPAERAVCMGWKYYGEGWFGHVANTTTSISFMRFHPGERAAIVMCATNDIALFAFSCLFQDCLPELKSSKLPRRLTARESESLCHESYVGTYVQAKAQIEIARTNQGRLSLAIRSDDPDLRTPFRPLDAADDDIFFPGGKHIPEFPFIQFLRSPGCDSFNHLWNGRHLWRRA